MRKPNEKCVLGKFRSVAGITVAQLAEILRDKVSSSLIEKMESASPKSGRSLTPEIAKVISEETNVSRRWLMTGDVSRPIVTETGDPYEASTLNDYRRQLAVPDGLSDPKNLLWKRYVEAQKRAQKLLGTRDRWDQKNKLLMKKFRRDYDVALESETQKQIKEIPYPKLKRDGHMEALVAAQTAIVGGTVLAELAMLVIASHDMPKRNYVFHRISEFYCKLRDEFDLEIRIRKAIGKGLSLHRLQGQIEKGIREEMSVLT
jgi:hypothetical protein